MMRNSPSSGRFDLIDMAPPRADFRAEVVAGLSGSRKRLPPKFFYDAEGCRLFEAICEAPEYYLTRAEIEILSRHAGEIAEAVGSDLALIELGSGSSRKIRLLLDALRPKCYLALDIARDHLAVATAALSADYPWLDIRAVCVDYSLPFALPMLQPGLRKLAFFPGSSIGNFDPDGAMNLLRNIAALVGPGGGLLVGFDLKKDREALNRAYNDAQGVTADFNLNLLRRINRELEADFQLERFRHHAFFNEGEGRVEMHLVSLETQSVRISGAQFHFAAEETIHTENSYKYALDEFHGLAAAAGLVPQRSWFDPGNRFCVLHLRVDG